MPDFRNVTFDEIELGKSASLDPHAHATEVEALALVSGDVDPFHIAATGRRRRPGPAVAQAVGVP